MIYMSNINFYDTKPSMDSLTFTMDIHTLQTYL